MHISWSIWRKTWPSLKTGDKVSFQIIISKGRISVIGIKPNVNFFFRFSFYWSCAYQNENIYYLCMTFVKSSTELMHQLMHINHVLICMFLPYCCMSNSINHYTSSMIKYDVMVLVRGTHIRVWSYHNFFLISYQMNASFLGIPPGMMLNQLCIIFLHPQILLTSTLY